MPYKIRHRGSGYKVTTPNHPQGFSKHPMSKQKAVAQLRAIKMNTDESLAERIVNVLLNENEEDGEPYGETCPACGGDAYELGRLGNTIHWRCRQCGYDFPEDTTPPPKGVYFSGAGYSGAGMHAVGGSGGLDTGGSAVG